MPASQLRRTLLLAGSAALVLSACGFRLRGPQVMPFNTIHVQGVDPYSSFATTLRRQIEANGSTRVVSSPEDADVRLNIVRNEREREILSLSGGGAVREYQLDSTLMFRLLNRQGNELLPLSALRARREYDFDDAQVIAKQREEAMLYADMETDLIQQLVRRLAAVTL